MLSALALRFSTTGLRHHAVNSVSILSKNAALYSTRPIANSRQASTDSSVWHKALINHAKAASIASSLSPEERWREKSDKLEVNPPPGVYAGRSLSVRPGELGRAMQNLTRRLRENRVAVQWKRQMRHEKKGVKRRRLVSERWRRRFADEIRRKIMLVRAIQRRGH